MRHEPGKGMALRVVARDHALQMWNCGSKLPKKDELGTENAMTKQLGRGMLPPLCRAQHLHGDVVGLVVLPPVLVKGEQPEECWEQQLALTHFTA